MAVYNSEAYLERAMQSILNQTFTNFEFVLIDDCSSDESPEIISAIKDPRVKVFRNQENIGLTRSLVKGLEYCTGEYIARMDADDVAKPLRLEKQVEYMDNNPQTVVCGSFVIAFADRPNTLWVGPVTDPECRIKMLFGNPLYHPTTIIRKSVVDETGVWYDPNFRYAQDFDLWERLSQFGELHNIPEALLLYRFHDKSIGRTKKDEQMALAGQVSARVMSKLGLKPTAEEWEIHRSLLKTSLPEADEYYRNLENWLEKLSDANSKYKLFDPRDLRQYISANLYDKFVKLRSKQPHLISLIIASKAMIWKDKLKALAKIIIWRIRK